MTNQFDQIILIGPFGVGKTTVGRLLKDKLGLPLVSLDDLCYGYYEEIGWSGQEALRIYEQEGGDAFNEYLNSFEPYGVEQVLLRNHGCVIDMGGGQTVYDDQARFARVKNALAPYPNVVLLLPSEDLEKSFRVLKERRRSEFLEYLIRNPCNYVLAKHIVYTEDKSPDQTANELLRQTST